MSDVLPFGGFSGVAPATITPTTSTTRVALNFPGYDVRRFQARLHNKTGSVVHIKAGSSSVTAATTDRSLAVGAIEILSFKDVTHLAAILPTGTATGVLEVETGQGN